MVYVVCHFDSFKQTSTFYFLSWHHVRVNCVGAAKMGIVTNFLVELELRCVLVVGQVFGEISTLILV